MHKGEMFPILMGHNEREKVSAVRRGGAIALVVQAPWSLFAPHERQAQTNHGQTLARLAERGGLSAAEAVAVLDDRNFERMNEGAANARLLHLIYEHTRALADEVRG